MMIIMISKPKFLDLQVHFKSASCNEGQSCMQNLVGPKIGDAIAGERWHKTDRHVL